MSNSLNGVIADASRRRLLDDWAIIQRWTGGSAPTTLTEGPSFASNFNAICPLPNDKFAVAQEGNLNGFRIYDLNTGTSTVKNFTGIYDVYYMFNSGVNEITFFGSVIFTYNYETNTQQNKTGSISTTSTNGIVKGPNNKFYSVPSYFSTDIRIYDPIAGNVVNGPSHGFGSISTTSDSYGVFWDAVSTPFGKIIYVPASATSIGIYDVATNSFSLSSYTGPIADMFKGGVLAPNGKIIFIPFGKNSVGRVGIYDPIADTFQLGASTQTNVHYKQGFLTPSGKIILIPQGIVYSTSPSLVLKKGGNFGIYDPFTDTFSVGPINSYLNLGSDLLGGAKGCLTTNGKIIYISNAFKKFFLLEGGNDVIASHEKAITSSYLNVSSSFQFGAGVNLS